MKKPNFKNFLGMTAIISFIILFSACDNEPVDERPDLPPIESMMMDFSDFEGQPGGAKASEISYSNFTHSYFSAVLTATRISNEKFSVMLYMSSSST